MIKEERQYQAILLGTNAHIPARGLGKPVEGAAADADNLQSRDPLRRRDTNALTSKLLHVKDSVGETNRLCGGCKRLPVAERSDHHHPMEKLKTK